MSRPADELAARSLRRSRLVDAIHGSAGPPWARPLVAGVLLVVLVAGVVAGPGLAHRLQSQVSGGQVSTVERDR